MMEDHRKEKGVSPSEDFSNFTLQDLVETHAILNEGQIQGIQKQVRTLDKYPLEATKTRNIIMLGRSGSGKTTAINVLKDPCSLPRPQSLFSDTVGARFQSFSLDDKDIGVKFSVNIIDTPGVGEVKPMGESARSDSVIIETIKYCLKNEITRIHTLLIFASFGERIGEWDKKAFKIYLDMFYDKKVNIAFCITKSEGKDATWREMIIQDLSQDQYFSTILKTDNIKVFFTGCVDQLRINEAPNPKALFERYNEIYNKRKELINFIFQSSDEGVMLLDLPVVSGSKKSMTEMLAGQGDILTKLENTTDFDTGPVNILIDTFSENIGYMIENDGMFVDTTLYSMFLEMKQRMKLVAKKMLNDNMRARFTSRVVL